MCRYKIHEIDHPCYTREKDRNPEYDDPEHYPPENNPDTDAATAASIALAITLPIVLGE